MKKLYNVYGTFGRVDKNYHVLGKNKTEVRAKVLEVDAEICIKAISVESNTLFVELGMPVGAYKQAYTEAQQNGGIYLYDEGT